MSNLTPGPCVNAITDDTTTVDSRREKKPSKEYDTSTASASHPLPPDGFIRPDHHLVSAADEWKPENHRFLCEAGEPALVRHLRVAQAELVEAPGVLVDERHYPEFLRKSSQLTN